MSDGDVYLYGTGDHCVKYIECCSCRLTPEDDWWGCVRFTRYSDVHRHLLAHRSAGHIVPQYAFDRIREERRKVGNDVQHGDKSFRVRHAFYNRKLGPEGHRDFRRWLKEWKLQK